jgi:predicted DCC family thiol-disulfide oxidoreductase YuxK
MERRERIKTESGKAVLIYDGNCPICSNTVAWIKEHEQRDVFEMLPCQSEDRNKRYPRMEESTCMQAMQLVLPGGNVLAAEKALPEIFKRLKRYRAAAGLFKLPGSNILARAFYRWFAGRRYRIAKILYPHSNRTPHHGKKSA